MTLHYTQAALVNFNEFNLKVEHSTLTQDFALHTHSFSEIVIIVSGNANHVIGKYSYPVKTGDVFVIKGELSHGFTNVEALELINLMYDDTLLSYANEELRTIPGFEPLFLIEPEVRYTSEYNYMLSLAYKDISYVVKMTELILDLLENRDALHEIVIKTSFLALISYLSSKYPVKSDISIHMQTLSACIKFIKNNQDTLIHTSDIAQAAFVSVRHLNRLFERYYHTTPTQYLNDLRLGKAYMLLSKSSLPIFQIAISCGFSEAGYFSRTFKAKYGLSPKEIRRGCLS